MPRCRGLTASGDQCSRSAEPGDAYCWWHSPKHAEQRRRNASRAARSKPSRELRALKDQLQQIAEGTLGGVHDPKRAAVAVQALNIKSRVLELERRWREIGELAERLEALETKLVDGEEAYYG